MPIEPEKSRVERRRQDARKRILEVAHQLFIVEAKYEETTMRDIASRADVSVGAVYLHFKSKSDILAEILNESFNSIMVKLSIPFEAERSGSEQLKAFVALFCRLSTEGGIHLLILFLLRIGPSNLEDAPVSAILNAIDQFIALLARIIQKGIDDGSLAIKEDPRMVAVVFFHCLQGLLSFDSGNDKIRRHLAAGFSFSEVIEGFINLFLQNYALVGDRSGNI
jgi:AcrR family transcriptional regulator